MAPVSSLLAAGFGAFSALWATNVTAPYDPLSHAISLKHGVVAVGGRDCPDNSENSLFYYDVQKGKSAGPSVPGLSQIKLAVDAETLVVAGMGWNKLKGTTFLGGPGNFHQTEAVSPSMETPVDISNDGKLSAFLYEPNPDEAHLNNRTGTLQLVDDSGKVTFTHKVAGQGAFDPQLVTVAAHKRGDVYTIGALFGSVNTIVDYNYAEKSGKVVWSEKDAVGGGSIALNGDGTLFALTSNDGLHVDVYARSTEKGARAAFSKISTLTPPKSGMNVMNPLTLAMSQGTSESPTLAVVWGDQDGTTVILRAHVINGSAVDQIWESSQVCQGGGSFNYVLPRGLSVTAKGELVVLGSWGCTEDSGSMMVFKGNHGDGKPIFSATFPGQVWATSCQVSDEGTEAYVAAGSWKSQSGSSPSQTSMFRASMF